MRHHKILLALVVVLAALILGSCGGDGGGDDGQFLSSFTGDCPRGPLGYWDCNMTWDQECWQ